MAPKINIDTIIFDMDGTLIDSELVAVQVIQECFGEWGHEVQLSDAGSVIGKKWDVALDYLVDKFKPKRDRDEITETVFARFRSKMDSNFQIVPGSAEAVKELGREFTLGLVSGSHRKDIDTALERLGIADEFEVILGAEDYPHSKPHPSGYQKAFNLIGASPESVLVFEDSVAGIDSALAAGLWVAAITSTNHASHDQSKAHWHVDDFKSVSLDWVKNLRRK